MLITAEGEIILIAINGPRVSNSLKIDAIRTQCPEADGDSKLFQKFSKLFQKSSKLFQFPQNVVMETLSSRLAVMLRLTHFIC